jgi:acetyltransferase-like isoleucine patch superfamily enzyme
MISSTKTDLWAIRFFWFANQVRFGLLRNSLQGKVEFGNGCDIWAGNFFYKGNGKAVIGKNTSVERTPFPFCLETQKNSVIELGDSCWVRGKYRPNVITAFENAKVKIGSDSLINGAIISSRASVTIGKKAMLSWNVSILDSNQHPLSNSEPVSPKPVEIGDYVLFGNGVTVLSGVKIGSHCVIGAGSVVTKDIPDHCLAAGSPARPIRELDDRDECT